jgi:hypothetical protein
MYDPQTDFQLNQHQPVWFGAGRSLYAVIAALTRNSTGSPSAPGQLPGLPPHLAKLLEV